MDEEAQKRNTDCVYFLASPLTCKKGNSCEFRHSEAARMKPRDCWYWIHSTCRNPNCSFRHPPLEGKPVSSLPPQTSTTTAATVPPASTASMPAAALSSKSKTPCYFFSQGHCTKGDKCPFMHGTPFPSSLDSTTQQKPLTSTEAVQSSNKPVVMLKGYSSNATKQTRQENSEKQSVQHNEAQLVSSKVPTRSAHETLQSEKNRVPESLVTTNSCRSEKVPGSRKSRVSLFSDTPEEFLSSVEGHRDMQSPAEKSRQGQLGRKWQQQSQHENEHPHSLQAADHRYQNGSRSDVWWKNESSSLDGDGSDQSIQRQGGECSPRQGSQGRVKVFDDSTGYALQTSKSYGQVGSDGAPFQRRRRFEVCKDGLVQEWAEQGRGGVQANADDCGGKLRGHGWASATPAPLVDVGDAEIAKGASPRNGFSSTAAANISSARPGNGREREKAAGLPPQSHNLEASSIVRQRSEGNTQQPIYNSNVHKTAVAVTATAMEMGVAFAKPRLDLQTLEWPRILIALSRKEKEDDFLIFKGTKLPQRPKKRPKAVERALHFCMPGSSLCDLSRSRYDVREKKSTRKRARGLKAMESMESESD